MKIELVGVHKVVRVLRDGTKREHFYAWRGGPSIKGEPGTVDFLDHYRTLVRERRDLETKTLSSILDAFQTWTEFKKDLRPKSKREYLRHLRTIEREWGDLPISAFTQKNAPRLRGVIMDWRDKNSDKPRDTDYLIQVFRRIVSVAILRGKLEANPLLGIGNLYKQGVRRTKIWTDALENKFLKDAPAHFHLPFMIALYTGLRLGDVLRMIYSPLPLEDGQAHYDGRHLYLCTSKTGEYVKVRAIEPLTSMLDANFDTSELIVKNSRGKPWSGVESFSSSFGKITEEIGVTDLTFHDLRGSAVTRLQIAGCTIAQIAAVTGHSQASAEAILKANYLGGTADLAEQAMGVLERRRSEISLQAAL